MELARIYSVSGRLGQREGQFFARPFRNPHHTISAAGLAGGGTVPKPGELSLAHKGVLFLDELTEFKREVLEVLRQPLEEKAIRISRSGGNFCFPADIMLIGAMNPCGCGYYPDRGACACTPAVIRRHLGKLSRPLLDRIDLTVEVRRLPLAELIGGGAEETSEAIRNRVQAVQKVQGKRFAGSGISYNSQIPVPYMEEFCPMEQDARKLLQDSFERLGLSARGYYRAIRVARTIADMEGCGQIRRVHLMESLMYREIDRKAWEL